MLELIYSPLDELLAKQHRENPKTHDVPKIRASFARFGYTIPVTVDEKSDVLVTGHGRLQSLDQMRTEGQPPPRGIPIDASGAWLVPVLRGISFASEKDRDDYVIADNRLSEIGGWDEAKLRTLLGKSNGALNNPESLGYSPGEMRRLMSKFSNPINEPSTAEASPATRTQPGDVWFMGPHRLMCGSSTDRPSVIRLLEGQGAGHLLVTSPPYNCEIDYDVYDDNQDHADYLAFIGAVVGLWAPMLEPGGFVGWNVGVSVRCDPVEHALILRSNGLRFFRQIVWSKSNGSPTLAWGWNHTVTSGKAGQYHPHYEHEMIYLYTRGEVGDRGECDVDAFYGSDVWRIPQHRAGVGDPDHPAPFPPAIPLGLIKHLTVKGDIVVDPFSGSGSTLVACEATSRVFRGMELSPAYVDRAVARWERLTQMVATKIPG